MTVDVLTFAKKLDNYAIDATGAGATGTTYWLDTTHYRVTVPASKRWKFIAGWCGRAVNSNANGFIRNAADDPLCSFVTQAAAASG
ncbi:unnamed protein product, partial [marine sediment metagenome]